MKENLPAPKCPEHRVFMRFRAGTFPTRWYFCPLCRDHWCEAGIFAGRVQLKRAFEKA